MVGEGETAGEGYYNNFPCPQDQTGQHRATVHLRTCSGVALVGEG